MTDDGSILSGERSVSIGRDDLSEVMSSGGETLSSEPYNRPVRRRPDTKRHVVPDGSSDAERTKYFA